MADVVVELLRDALEPLRERVAALESRTDLTMPPDAKRLAGIVADAMKAALELPANRIENLQKRVNALEARPIPEHMGTWTSGKPYKPMQLAQFRGSCWCALVETSARPGDPDSGGG